MGKDSERSPPSLFFFFTRRAKIIQTFFDDKIQRNLESMPDVLVEDLNKITAAKSLR